MTKIITLHGRKFRLYINGDMYSLDTFIMFKRQLMSNGYHFYAFRDTNGKQKNVSVHRLIAIHFIPNPNNYKEVNHIDGNKINNHISNLEWVNKSMNMKHAYRLGLCTPVCIKGKENPESVRVNQFDLNGKLIKTYDCINDAAKELGVWRQNISQACRGIRKTVKNSTWKYA
jgi:hypothetical protein